MRQEREEARITRKIMYKNWLRDLKRIEHTPLDKRTQEDWRRLGLLADWIPGMKPHLED